ncbi:MAG: carboxymuconolactone decarboxylase family protein [Solirubrobacterales bacterium]|nr:carboxymuconolactone decarboxylase family protein [Solirubrobacterales bacterium]
MSRVPLVAIDSDDEVVAEVFGRFREEGREPIALYRALANSPALLRAYSGLANALRHQASVPRSLRELVILRIATLTGSRYERAHHVPMARAAGVAEAKIAGVEDWLESNAFDERERALLRCADEVHRCALSDEAFAELERFFDADEITELLLLLGFYEAVARVIDGLGLELEPQYQERP